MRSRSVLAVFAACVALLAACSGGGGQDAGADAGTAPPGSDSGPCPANLVVQTDWFPEIEHGGTYQLIGTGGTSNAENLSYSGPLRNRYKGAHGVQTVEIRAGGAAVDNRSVTDVMYDDPDITFGFVNTDDAIAGAAAGRGVVGVVGSLDVSPQMLMWSPTAAHDQELRRHADVRSARLVLSRLDLHRLPHRTGLHRR